MPGENTMTKLIERLDQSISRRFSIVPVISRPSTLTVMVSPIFKLKATPVSASSEISGGP